MYQALYRKYRPKTFDDVVGQDFVIKTLKNAIVNDKISHAYMFFGPRGIGKTTIAKIMSRAVNCLNTKDGNPCEKCDNCLKSKEKENVDIIEIDAASNNGVDEIREIKSKVNIVPSELKYKVYIVDEVHMLTSGAFNALLKTLEEPPKHVIFILATTDPQKVSDTIISRCQCYSFKRISVDKTILKLNNVCKEEKIDIDEDVLKMIAEYSDGGLRDALGLLDKISSYKKSKITKEDFYEINDMISIEDLNNFKNMILSSNYKEILKVIDNFNNNGKNLIEIVKQLIISLRDDIVNYYVDDYKLQYSVEKYQELLNLFNEKMFDIKKSGNPKIYIEVILLDYMKNGQNISREIISQEIKVPEKEPKTVEKYRKKVKIIDKVEKTKPIVIEEEKKVNVKIKKKTNTLKNSNILDILKIRVHNILATATKEEKISDVKKINLLNDYVFDQKIGYVVSEILNSNLRASSEDGIILSYEYNSVVDQNIDNIEQIIQIFNELTNSNKNIAIISDEEWNNVKNEYINDTKNGTKYDIIEEPELIINNSGDNEEKGNNDLDSNPMDLFRDIVEIK